MLGAWLSSRAPSTPEVRRLAAAVERAGLTFAWSQYRLVALLTVFALVLGLVSSAWWSPAGSVFSRSESGFWFGLTLLLGAASTCLVVHLASRLTARATAGVAAASERGASEAHLLALRAGGGAAIAAEAVCSLGFLGCVFVAAATKSADSAVVSAAVVRLVPGYALGAAIAAGVLHRGAAVLESSANLAAAHPELDASDSRNPAAVSRLLGEGLARTVGASADYFLAASLGNLAMALVAARVLSEGEGNDALLSWVALPFVIRAFGLLATCFGTLAARANEREEAQVALLRGGLTTFVTLLGGVVASAFWLTGSVGASRTSVVVFAVALVSFAFVLVARAIMSSPPPRSRPSSAVSHVASTTALAFAATAGAVVLVAVAFLSAAALLPETPEFGAGARPWISTIVVAWLFALGPQWLAFQLSATTARAARGMLELGDAEEHRTSLVSRLASGHEPLLFAARSQLSIAGAAAALLGALSLLRAPLSAGATSSSAPEGALWTACAPLGVALVLGFVGTGLGSASRTANGASVEVTRQLAAFVGEDGRLALPADFAPSYRTCIDACQAELRKNLFVPLLFVIVGPLLLGLLLRITFDADAARTGLCVFGIVASVVGLLASWASVTAAGALGARSRSSDSPSSSLHSPAAVPAAAFGATERLTIVGACALMDACGPMAQVFAKASVVTSIVIACFLI